MTSFNAFSISYHNDKYFNSASRKLDDTGIWTQFTFNITGKSSIDAYLGVDFYTPRMYPDGCKLKPNNESHMTYAVMNVYRNGVFLNDTWIWDVENYGYLNQKWAPGTYQVFVRVPEWHPDEVPDYTFRIYSPAKINVAQVTYNTLAEGAAAMARFDF